jgi:hypothetical protein
MPFASKEGVKGCIDKGVVKRLKDTPGKEYTDSAGKLYAYL